MDRFAAMERQINRAWSASADGVYEAKPGTWGRRRRPVRLADYRTAPA